MKTIPIVSLVALSFILVLAGCVGPAVRHNTRVDRRHDAAERIESRSTNRQYNRYDRRGDRYDRRAYRYGY